MRCKHDKVWADSLLVQPGKEYRQYIRAWICCKCLNEGVERTKVEISQAVYKALKIKKEENTRQLDKTILDKCNDIEVIQ